MVAIKAVKVVKVVVLRVQEREEGGGVSDTLRKHSDTAHISADQIPP
jgi:hypothetical protein